MPFEISPEIAPNQIPMCYLVLQAEVLVVYQVVAVVVLAEIVFYLRE